jgi:hypothetical protein
MQNSLTKSFFLELPQFFLFPPSILQDKNSHNVAYINCERIKYIFCNDHMIGMRQAITPMITDDNPKMITKRTSKSKRDI